MIKEIIMFGVLMAALGGRGCPTKNVTPPADPTAVDIREIPYDSDFPEFRRQYTSTLDNRCVIEVSVKTFLSRRWFDARLIQPDGRYIFFDVDKVTDKILDPLLVPLVENQVANIKNLDEKFIASNPSFFKDARGDTWRRDPK